MTTLEELFEEFQKLPDWQRYPLPDVLMKTFNLKPLQPASLTEVVGYHPPPYASLNVNGKVEIREPVEGGVRQLEGLPAVPVEVKKVNEETGDLEDFPPPRITLSPLEAMIQSMSSIAQSVSYTQPDSGRTMSNPPTEHNMIRSLPGTDRSSQDLFDAFPYISPSVLCRDAVCSPPSQRPRSVSSSSDLQESQK